VLLVGSAALFCWLGSEYVHRFGPYSPPSAGIPEASPIAVSNNKAALLRLPVNLEGIAVIYPEQVVALVDADGEFRTELSLGELARVLLLDPRTIARQGSNNEIDPEAALFTAVTGRLSERARARSRRLREAESEGIRLGAVSEDEWVTVDVPFSLNRLRYPNPEQKIILEAISRSARCLVREPGAKVNAVPLPFLDSNHPFRGSQFAAGYLPLEPLPGDLGMDGNPSPE
jgi:hypothetical protein